MTLEQFQKILQFDELDTPNQMKVLGYDISKLSVKEVEDILKMELSASYEPQYTEKFKSNGRKFKVLFDIEQLNGGEYAYFKQVLGDIQADDVDANDELVVISEDVKIKRLFNQAHKIISVFLKEKTWFKRHLDFQGKQELVLKSDIKDIMPLIFFLLKQIGNLQRSTTIYYLNQVQKKNQ